MGFRVFIKNVFKAIKTWVAKSFIFGIQAENLFIFLSFISDSIVEAIQMDDDDEDDDDDDEIVVHKIFINQSYKYKINKQIVSNITNSLKMGLKLTITPFHRL